MELDFVAHWSFLQLEVKSLQLSQQLPGKAEFVDDLPH